MNRFTLRLLEVCVIAVVGFSPGLASAEPRSEGHDVSYAYFGKEGSITMSGDSRDISRARSLKQGAPMLWFRDGGQEYTVRDPDTLAQLEAIWKPGRELDAAEAVLDRQEAVLDRQHDQLDAKREAIDSRRESLADRAAELAEREADDSVSAAARADAAKQRRALQPQQQALSDELRALEAPMKELRAQIEALRQKAEPLRQKQRVAASKEQVEVRALLRRAITAGTAKPAK